MSFRVESIPLDPKDLAKHFTEKVESLYHIALNERRAKREDIFSVMQV